MTERLEIRANKLIERKKDCRNHLGCKKAWKKKKECIGTKKAKREAPKTREEEHKNNNTENEYTKDKCRGLIDDVKITDEELDELINEMSIEEVKVYGEVNLDNDEEELLRKFSTA